VVVVVVDESDELDVSVLEAFGFFEPPPVEEDPEV
jgi:hypothetical protein